MYVYKYLYIISAEYVIDLAEKNDTFDKLKKALEERDAQFSVSYKIYKYIRLLLMVFI